MMFLFILFFSNDAILWSVKIGVFLTLKLIINNKYTTMIIQIEINDCFKHIPFGVFDDECNFTISYDCNFPIKEDKVNDFIKIVKSNHNIVEVLAILNRCGGDFKSYLDEVVAVAIDGMGDIDIAQCFENDEDDFDPSWWEEQFKQDYLNNK